VEAMKNYALITAGTIFSLASLAHLARMILAFQVNINGFDIPVSWSLPPCIAALGLAVWMFMAARSSTKFTGG
jgi:hypothetical protein